MFAYNDVVPPLRTLCAAPLSRPRPTRVPPPVPGADGLSAGPLQPRRPALCARPPPRSLPAQLLRRELGLGPVVVSRQLLTSFRRSLLRDAGSGVGIGSQGLSCCHREGLEFLRAHFACLHLRVCFERLGAAPGDGLAAQVAAFCKLLREPKLSVCSVGREWSVAFFRHLREVGVDRLLLLLLEREDATSPALRARNQRLLLRVLRRLCRRKTAGLGRAIVRTLATDNAFVTHCVRLMGSSETAEDAVVVMEEVVHGHREEMSVSALVPGLRSALSGAGPRLAARICRILVLFCSAVRAGSHSEATLICADNQRAVLDGIPDLLLRLVTAIDFCMQTALPRPRLDGLANEEELWFRWLDAEDAKAVVKGTAFIKTAIERVLMVQDLLQAVVLLRMLLWGPHADRVRDELVRKCQISSRMCAWMDAMVWLDDASHTLLPDNVACGLPETPIKLQIVRCISLILEGCAPGEKRLFLSASENRQLKSLATLLPEDERDPSLCNLDLSQCCRGRKGLVQRIAVALMKQSGKSALRLWLSKCVESYLQGLFRPVADQQLLSLIHVDGFRDTSITLMEDQINQCFIRNDDRNDLPRDIDFTASGCLLGQTLKQQACDTLAAMIKFNNSTCSLFFNFLKVSTFTSDAIQACALPHEEQSAFSLAMHFFTVNALCSNVLLRAIAVTEAASIYHGFSCYNGNFYDHTNDSYSDFKRTLQPLQVCLWPASLDNKAERDKRLIFAKRSVKYVKENYALPCHQISNVLPQFVYTSILTLNPGLITNSNVCCLNTIIIIWVLKHRQNSLSEFLVSIQTTCDQSVERVLKFRRHLHSLLVDWRDWYFELDCNLNLVFIRNLQELALSWKVHWREMKGVVDLVMEDIERCRFPFIKVDYFMDLFIGKNCGRIAVKSS